MTKQVVLEFPVELPEESLQDKDISCYKPELIPYLKEVYKQGLCVSLMGDDWRYHEPVINDLRKQFTPLVELNGKCAGLLEEIRSSESVGMHVRLGDYTTNVGCLVLPVAYYNDCLTIMRRSLDNPSVYVFTDSPEMVRWKIDADLPVTLVEGNEPATDMALLSAWRHKIKPKTP